APAVAAQGALWSGVCMTHVHGSIAHAKIHGPYSARPAPLARTVAREPLVRARAERASGAAPGAASRLRGRYGAARAVASLVSLWRTRRERARALEHVRHFDHDLGWRRVLHFSAGAAACEQSVFSARAAHLPE